MTADKEPATMLRLTTAGDGSRRCHTRHPSQVLQRCCAASITQSARSTLASFVCDSLLCNAGDQRVLGLGIDIPAACNDATAMLWWDGKEQNRITSNPTTR